MMIEPVVVSGMPCLTCGNNKAWHDANPQTQHRYNDGSIPVSETFGKRLADGTRVPPVQQRVKPGDVVIEAQQWPFDPVLRQALVNKSVITPQDLKDAEEQIRAVTNQFAASGGVPS